MKLFINFVTTIRAVFGLLYLGVSTSVTVFCIFIAKVFLGSHTRANPVIQAWGHSVCWVCGVKLKVKGLEKLPKGGFLYIFNHTSYFDILAMSAVFTGIRYGAKIELFKIPILGIGMKMAGVLPIARNNREEVFKVYKDAQVRFAKGERFALAPEGTRQKEEVLGNFKSGPFIFAINAGVKVVPVVVKGASKVMNKDTILPNVGAWSRTIEMEVLEAIDASEYTLEQRPLIQQRAYDLMKRHY